MEIMNELPSVLSDLVRSYFSGSFSLQFSDAKEASCCVYWFKNDEDQIVVGYLCEEDRDMWLRRNRQVVREYIYNLPMTTSSTSSSKNDTTDCHQVKIQNISFLSSLFQAPGEVHQNILWFITPDKWFHTTIPRGYITLGPLVQGNENYHFFGDPFSRKSPWDLERRVMGIHILEPCTKFEPYNPSFFSSPLQHDTPIISLLPWKQNVLILDQDGLFWNYKSKFLSILGWTKARVPVPKIKFSPHLPLFHERVEMQIQDDMLWIKYKQQIWYRCLFGCLK